MNSNDINLYERHMDIFSRLRRLRDRCNLLRKRVVQAVGEPCSFIAVDGNL